MDMRVELEKSLVNGDGAANNTLEAHFAGFCKRKIDSLASPTKTATSSASPMTTAMITANWLHTVIAPLPPKPSVELERFLSSCDKDVTADVIWRAQLILMAIFPSSGEDQGGSLMDNIWVEQRQLEAWKLYYHVLQAICTAESQMLHTNNLTSLLESDRFHRCMLACSAEIVLSAHKTSTMLFPALLERTGITAFDLCKVIECFIRHEESLPREMKRHLNSLEESLLESMVWEKGSSLYNWLIVARPTLSAKIKRLSLLAEPMPSLSAVAKHVNMLSGCFSPGQSMVKKEIPGFNGDIRSPKTVRTGNRSGLVDRSLPHKSPKAKVPPRALRSSFASPTKLNPGGGEETCAEAVINVFFGKIVKLAAVRINAMAERLQLSQHIRESVYCVFQRILDQRTTLFFNRHIDQIILCCFYAVAKISGAKLEFKTIVNNYKKRPHCKPLVLDDVYVDSASSCYSGETVSRPFGIVEFYNKIFVSAVKPLLVDLALGGPRNNSDGVCPGTPKTSPFPSLPDMSPKKVSPMHNVYVSPLRSSKTDALITHGSKSSYACVGESTHAYQSPSKDLTAINNLFNGTRKLRGALQFDDADVQYMTDSMVTNSL